VTKVLVLEVFEIHFKIGTLGRY